MNFINQRKNKSINNDDLVVVNSTNIKGIYFENEDKDYYFNYLGCIFCQGNYKSFPAMFLHMKFCHPELESYFSVRNYIINNNNLKNNSKN